MINTKNKLIMITLMILLALSIIFNGILCFFLIDSQYSEENFDLKLESINIELYEGYSYVYTEMPYQLRAKVNNHGTGGISSFNVKFYQNLTEITTSITTSLGAGDNILINSSWIPHETGLINLTARIIRNNIVLSSNFTLVEVNNISLTGYGGGAPITTKYHGLINGTMKYLMGNDSQVDTYEWMSSGESYILYYNFSSLELSGDLYLARMHAYFSWSYLDPVPNISIQVNQSSGPSNWVEVEFDDYYTDRKGFGSSNYPSGTLVYNMNHYIGLDDEIYINFTNMGSSFAMYGASIVIISNNSGTDGKIEYWINEGCDILSQTSYAPKDNPAYDPTAVIPFNKPEYQKEIHQTTLMTFVPGGDLGLNSLRFNNLEKYGIYNSSNAHLITISEMDVTDYISSNNNNIAEITDLGDYIVPSVAFLLVEY